MCFHMLGYCLPGACSPRRSSSTTNESVPITVPDKSVFINKNKCLVILKKTTYFEQITQISLLPDLSAFVSTSLGRINQGSSWWVLVAWAVLTEVVQCEITSHLGFVTVITIFFLSFSLFLVVSFSWLYKVLKYHDTHALTVQLPSTD